MREFTLSLLLVLSSSLGFAQSSFFDSYVYQSWSAFGGLTGTTATDIYQTVDGYINIGTYEGLVRFDGVEFKTFNRAADSSLDFVSVRTILQDSKGNIWVGSNDEGLQKISNDSTKLYTVENGLPNNSIRALVEDKRGNIWIGTAGGVAYLTPDGKIINAQFDSGTVANGVIATSLFCDAAGQIWLTTQNERGLFLYNNEIFQQLYDLESYGIYFASSVFQDRSGKFWIGLEDNGLITIERGVIKKITTGTKLDNTSTRSIIQEYNGNIWFGTEHGPVIYTDGQFIEYNVRSGLEEANIKRIIQDREGNIWFATDRNGIGKLTYGKFQMKKLNVTVNAIAEGKDSRIWAGTDEGVICFLDDKPENNRLTQYTKGLRIRDVSITSEGYVLVSCYTKPGQLLYDGNKITNWTTDNDLAGNKVRVAIESSPGEYYVGTTTGLSVIHRDGTVKNFRQTNGLETEYIMALYKDTHDVIWIGTDGGGIYLMKDERIINHLTFAEGLAGNVIFKISQDANNGYWICTGNGISYTLDFDPSKNENYSFITIGSEHGIGTNSVFQVLFDRQKNMWMTNNHGVASVTLENIDDFLTNKSKQITAKYYNKNDGLDSDGPTSTSCSLVDRHGRLWITLIDGIAVYDPLKVHKNSITPLVHIETITVDNVEFKNTGEMIMLKPGTKRIDIKFTGISFDAPERILFSHMLSNFESNYSIPSAERIVSYTNLTPGRHSFLVNAINGNGVQSGDDEMMFFYQKPYLYQRPVFWVIAGILFISSIFAFFFIRERRVIKENLRLEALVYARTADLEIEKDKSDKLLRSILPDKIADILKETPGEKSFAENFDDVTILFTDIVGFTTVSSGHSANEIVSALNNLFSRFDERAKKMKVEKIKTIGDAYMAACGIPEANKDHAKIMVKYAKGLLEDVKKYNQKAAIKFSIRIGLNCGPVTAGVIGTTKFIYDVWGDTVNVASRMETAAKTNTIRITEDLKNHLNNTDFKFSRAIVCDIKGKGHMKTYEVKI
ncbi:MAG: hypothetical protein IK002_03310 [Treponema sp.]|uniref:adenylate/guanylate cyclase domain-containing protein n=1 Tax=Treponema sp. TaxID=166 RepID=UPI00298E4DDF|nr:adenylate/guanylate cyclase domain-containing protein [Treponema sp.]MBR5932995.1 hypothetical protein [Treponema sp.]